MAAPVRTAGTAGWRRRLGRLGGWRAAGRAAGTAGARSGRRPWGAPGEHGHRGRRGRAVTGQADHLASLTPLAAELFRTPNVRDHRYRGPRGTPREGTAAVAYEFQVTVDCADPHTLADWWAQTLGWQVEPQDEDFIRRMISEGYASDADTTLAQRKARLARGLGDQPPRRHQAGPASAVPAGPRGQDGEKPSAPRPAHRRQRRRRRWSRAWSRAARRRCAKAGRARTPGSRVADPEGNEFCVSPSAPPAG